MNIALFIIFLHLACCNKIQITIILAQIMAQNCDLIMEDVG